ncbi:MAG: DNA adenine methylase [Phyllobacteriaceae bacterium]|nr:DNA adenine methylase [Phyllobacteriaceae bacterium]
MTWPGGKNGAGAYQRIINHMPPHRAYVEAFLGSGAVLRNKRPARINVAIDPSEEAHDLCQSIGGAPANTLWLHEDALTWLERRAAKGWMTAETLIYCDPPYPMQTRKGGPLYEFELTDGDHQRLLAWATATPAMVMISGYRCRLYDDGLTGWHRIDYQAQTRQGLVEECLWMNFTPPAQLHDYGHLGGDFRERERIKRKKDRWSRKIAAMDRLERLAIMEVLTTVVEGDTVAAHDQRDAQ